MKRNMIRIIRLMLAGMFVFGSCTKDQMGPFDTTPPPAQPIFPPPVHYTNKTIRGLVQEYGSNLPLAGAKITVRAFNEDNETGYSDLELFTDSMGKCQFLSHAIQAYSASKPGYWDNNDFYPGYTAFFFPANSILTDMMKDADSFVIKLLPITSITIHLQDSSKTVDYKKLFADGSVISFQCNGMVTNSATSSSNFYPVNTIYLYPGIDTTFKCPVYGNSENELNVNIFTQIYETDILTRQFTYIPKMSDTTINIAY